jgi:putative component of toxin-antitoxin plasmid stabilization module
MFEIKHYITDDGRDVFEDWRDKVKDCGGIKRSQDADISKACEYWKDWQRSNVKQEKER